MKESIFMIMSPLWKVIRTEHLAESKQVFDGPCYVFSVRATGTEQGGSTAIIYDGQGVVGVPMVTLQVPQYGNDSFTPSFPMRFDRGIYVSLGADTTLRVTIQFLSVR